MPPEMQIEGLSSGRQSGRGVNNRGARSAGRVLDPGDALIAGTAKAHDRKLATRNVADFGGLDLDIVNPWQVQ